jgi:hypothetical protein
LVRKQSGSVIVLRASVARFEMGSATVVITSARPFNQLLKYPLSFTRVHDILRLPCHGSMVLQSSLLHCELAILETLMRSVHIVSCHAAQEMMRRNKRRGCS